MARPFASLRVTGAINGFEHGRSPLAHNRKARPLRDGPINPRYHPAFRLKRTLVAGHGPTLRGYAPARANGGFRPSLLTALPPLATLRQAQGRL